LVDLKIYMILIPTENN